MGDFIAVFDGVNGVCFFSFLRRANEIRDSRGGYAGIFVENLINAQNRLCNVMWRSCWCEARPAWSVRMRADLSRLRGSLLSAHDGTPLLWLNHHSNNVESARLGTGSAAIAIEELHHRMISVMIKRVGRIRGSGAWSILAGCTRRIGNARGPAWARGDCAPLG